MKAMRTSTLLDFMKIKNVPGSLESMTSLRFWLRSLQMNLLRGHCNHNSSRRYHRWDINGDGIVSIADLLLLMNSFGQPGVAAVALARGITEQTITVTPPAVGFPTGSGTGGAWLFSDLDTFDFPNPNSVNNQVYGWDSIDMTEVRTRLRLMRERQTDRGMLISVCAYMSVKATSQAPDMIAAICVVRVITQASANNDYEQAYMMYSPGNFDNNIIQVTGLDAPIGQQYDKQFYYISGDQNSNVEALFFSLKPECSKVILWNQIAGRCQLLIASSMILNQEVQTIASKTLKCVFVCSHLLAIQNSDFANTCICG